MPLSSTRPYCAGGLLLFPRPLRPVRATRREIVRIQKAAYSALPAATLSSTSPLPQRQVSPQTTPIQLQLQPRPYLRYSHTSTRANTMSSATTFYDFEPVDKKGTAFPLTQLKGKVVLVVNTASKCGFTPQFKSLETLYQSIKAKHPDDFTVLGFPCNQFGSQDPGSNDEIQQFCQLNYGVTFPVLGKTEVNGNDASPLWTWMKESQPGLLGLKRIKWNFEKFLISADGKVVGRWASTTKPESLEETILKEIEKAKKEGTLASSTKQEGETAKLA